MIFLFSGSLLRYVGYRRQIDYETGTLAIALGVLFAEYPDLKGLLTNPDGTLRRTLRLAINNVVIRDDLSRPLSPGDSVEIMTAIAGG
jgi:molybdopterin synthase sulfur carrier subunit